MVTSFLLTIPPKAGIIRLMKPLKRMLWAGPTFITISLLMGACTAPGAKLPIPAIFGTPAPTSTATVPPSPTSPPTPTPQPAQVIGDGQRQLNNGDWDSANQIFTQALAIQGADQEVQGSAQLGLAEVALRRGDFGGAKNSLDTFIATYPNHARIAQGYFLRGDAKMGLSDWQGAIADFNAYLTMRPGILDSYIHERLGDAYLALGQNDQALQNYEQSTGGGRNATAMLQLRERVALRERALANSLLNANQTDQASAAFNAVLGQYQAILSVAQIPSYKASIEYALAQTMFEAGQKDAAYDQYNHVFMTYPNSPEALESLRLLLDTDRDIDQYERGVVNFNQGQYDIAIAAFTAYRAATPPAQYTPESYIMIAQSYHKLGNIQAALTELQVFFTRVPANEAGDSLGDAWLEKASLQVAQKDTAGALKTYEQFVTDHSDMPQAADALYQAGQLAESSGDSERAVGYYQRLATQFPADTRGVDGIFSAGIDAYRAGDLAKAQTLFTLAAQTQSNPNPAASQLWLGKTLAAGGKVDDAMAAYNNAKAADPAGYYGVRADDLVTARALFAAPASTTFPTDADEGRADTETWIVQKFSLTNAPPLAAALRPEIANDPRLIRARELWDLGILVDARADFEDVRTDFQDDPLSMYQMAIYFRDIGLYRSSVIAAGRVLKLANVTPEAAPVFLARLRFPIYFNDLVTRLSAQYGLDPLFVYSVIWQESAFEGFATSSASAQGLMQIWPPTGQDIANKIAWPAYTPADLQRPLVSVTFGTWLISDELGRFNHDPFATLAAYNAGTGRAGDWQAGAKGDPDLYLETVSISETRDYIRQIYLHYATYRALYGAH